MLLMISRLCDDPVVVLSVGQDSNVFHVHLSLLCAASPVFRAAFSGGFKGAAERSMSLPEDTVIDLDLFVLWLYTRHIHMDVCETEEQWGERVRDLFLLYIFAEKYEVIQLKNDIVYEIFDIARQDKVAAPSPKIAEVMFTKTGSASSLRRLTALWYIWKVDLEWFRCEESSIMLLDSPEFILELVFAFAEHSQEARDPFEGKASDFREANGAENADESISRPTKRKRPALSIHPR